MSRRHRKRFDDEIEMSDRRQFSMCHRKTKFKSNEASRYANKYNQRKYECPLCGHWHLTKVRKYND